MKHVKTLGLVAVVVITLTAGIGAPPSSAAEFLSSASPVMLFGAQVVGANHIFTVDGQNAECNKAVFEKASLATPATTVPGITATYSECSLFGFNNGTVEMGSCTYEFLQPNAGLEGNVAVRCTGGPILIRVANSLATCAVTIGEAGNTNLANITYTNNSPSAGRVTATAAVNGITANKTVDEKLCPLSGTGTVNNVTYTGPVPFEGTGGITFSVL